MIRLQIQTALTSFVHVGHFPSGAFIKAPNNECRMMRIAKLIVKVEKMLDKVE